MFNVKKQLSLPFKSISRQESSHITSRSLNSNKIEDIHSSPGFLEERHIPYTRTFLQGHVRIYNYAPRSWNNELVEVPFKAIDNPEIVIKPDQSNLVLIDESDINNKYRVPCECVNTVLNHSNTAIQSGLLVFPIKTVSKAGQQNDTIHLRIYDASQLPSSLTFSSAFFNSVKAPSITPITKNGTLYLQLSVSQWDNPSQSIQADILAETSLFPGGKNPRQVPGPISNVLFQSQGQTIRFLDTSNLSGNTQKTLAPIHSYEAKEVQSGPLIKSLQITYTYIDKTNMTVTITAIAGDSGLYLSTETETEDSHEKYENWLEIPFDSTLSSHYQLMTRRNNGQTTPKPLSHLDEPRDHFLRAWDDWFLDRYSTKWEFFSDNHPDVFSITRHNPTRWIATSKKGTWNDTGEGLWVRLNTTDHATQQPINPKLVFANGDCYRSIRISQGRHAWGLELNKVKDIIVEWKSSHLNKVNLMFKDTDIIQAANEYKKSVGEEAYTKEIDTFLTAMKRHSAHLNTPSQKRDMIAAGYHIDRMLAVLRDGMRAFTLSGLDPNIAKKSGLITGFREMLHHINRAELMELSESLKTVTEISKQEILHFFPTNTPLGNRLWRHLIDDKQWLLEIDAETARINVMSDTFAKGLDIQFKDVEDKVIHALSHHTELSDFMRLSIVIINGFDLIRSLLNPSEYEEIKREMIYFAYRLNDARLWSTERGWRSGNPSMTYRFGISRGAIGLLFPDHPQANAWRDEAKAMIEHIESSILGNMSEIDENLHYIGNTLEFFLAYSLMHRNVIGSWPFKHNTIKQWARYLIGCFEPPNPRFNNRRTMASYSRGYSGKSFSIISIFARILGGVFPEIEDADLSRQAQYIWNETGNSFVGYDMDPMIGYERIVGKLDLAETPLSNTSTHTRDYIALRNGVGTNDEHYTFFLTGDNKTSASTGTGHGGASIKSIFSYGKPISSEFSNGVNFFTRHSPLQSRVMGASNWSPGQFIEFQRIVLFKENVKTTFLGNTDYTNCQHVQLAESLNHNYPERFIPNGKDTYIPHTKVPNWPSRSKTIAESKHDKKLIQHDDSSLQRQMLFIKNSRDPEDAHYYVFRDTVTGAPTEWTMWTRSNGLFSDAKPTIDMAKNRYGTAPTSYKGATIIEAVKDFQEIKGQRMTALGQYGVDIDYYIANKTDMTPLTMRWGYKDPHPPTYIHDPYIDYQDVLLLRNTRSDHYSVVMYPRKHDSAPPKFSTLADGDVIRVSIPNVRQDYILLSPFTKQVTLNDVEFFASAAHLRLFNKPEYLLSLSSPGYIKTTHVTLESDLPAELYLRASSVISQHNDVLEVDSPNGAFELELNGNTLIKRVSVTLSNNIHFDTQKLHWWYQNNWHACKPFNQEYQDAYGVFLRQSTLYKGQTRLEFVFKSNVHKVEMR